MKKLKTLTLLFVSGFIFCYLPLVGISCINFNKYTFQNKFKEFEQYIENLKTKVLKQKYESLTYLYYSLNSIYEEMKKFNNLSSFEIPENDYIFTTAALETNLTVAREIETNILKKKWEPTSKEALAGYYLVWNKKHGNAWILSNFKNNFFEIYNKINSLKKENFQSIENFSKLKEIIENFKSYYQKVENLFEEIMNTFFTTKVFNSILELDIYYNFFLELNKKEEMYNKISNLSNLKIKDEIDKLYKQIDLIDQSDYFEIFNQAIEKYLHDFKNTN
ncbi:hypothetical protein [Mycoplasmopsis cricetuli]|uniref:hypothetical protein n=1 Tax=Mycoplasmopsis cricetuli TaxID=171283 RepID=UPI00046FC1B9|nr:hypothetical protein [Mycoplasmopsis cricetuli]